MADLTKEEIERLFIYFDGNLYWRIKPSVRTNINVGDRAGSPTRKGYHYVGINKKYYSIHRSIYIMHFGSIPANLQIDHIDCNKGNNRIENLRIVTQSQNMRNASNKDKIKGVWWVKNRNKWRANISIDGVDTFIGYFNSKVEAYEAYKITAKEIYGEFAYTGE